MNLYGALFASITLLLRAFRRYEGRSILAVVFVTALASASCSREQPVNPALDKKIDLTLQKNAAPSVESKAPGGKTSRQAETPGESGAGPDAPGKAAGRSGQGDTKAEAKVDAKADARSAAKADAKAGAPAVPERRSAQRDSASNDGNSAAPEKAKQAKANRAKAKLAAKRSEPEPPVPDAPSLPQDEKNNPLHPGYQKQ